MHEMLGAMESLNNDTRGWIMAAVSGIACTVGASVICVDVIIRQFPGKQHFKIEDSNPFLSSGLSLSFGVMIFSSLFSMLPSSERYLKEGGMSSKAAKFTLIGAFLAGALGISILSRILHHFIPHSIAPCDHEHGDEEEGKAAEEEEHDHSHHAHHSHHHSQQPMEEQGRTLSSGDAAGDDFPFYSATHQNYLGPPRRPSLHATISSKVTQLVSGAADTCDANGQCQGYSNPCGSKCFKNIIQRPNGVRFTSAIGKHATRLAGTRTQTIHDPERQPLLPDLDETAPLTATQSVPALMDGSQDPPQVPMNGHPAPALSKQSSHQSLSASSSSSHAAPTDHHQPTHHHHVPTNAFLSIGLQTSCAIALHKIPEGFITYATNHANSKLGFAVFLALFIHNITEGFAMALPLYLAIGSRWKAMVWSTLLGGVSQPLGAGVAALWFRLAKRNGGSGGGEPGETVYGVLFAITAGIMAMVGLQLFGEALDLTHSRKLCFASAFIGMGILGVSSALTA